MADYLKTSQESGVVFEIITPKDKYEFTSSVLFGIKFRLRSKKEKHIVFLYLKFFTKYSISHLKKMANRWRKGTLVYNPSRNKHKFCQKYFPVDIKLLIDTDIAHECLSAEATVEIMKREYEILKAEARLPDKANSPIIMPSPSKLLPHTEYREPELLYSKSDRGQVSFAGKRKSLEKLKFVIRPPTSYLPPEDSIIRP